MTCPTPGTSEIFEARRLFATSCSCVSDIEFGCDRQCQDGLIGGIDLRINRRRRQAARQQAVGRVDGLLHILFRDVEIEREIELQGDDRGTGGAGGGHLRQARESRPAAPRAAQSRWSPSPEDSRRDRKSAPGWSDNRRPAARKSAGSARTPRLPARAQSSATRWLPASVRTGGKCSWGAHGRCCRLSLRCDAPEAGAAAPDFFLLGAAGCAPGAAPEVARARC